jgi:UDP-N-acetylmuramyl pentapeptide phosphotransferase/UDP-N-acetylglucosamine-1-phosphate transferase
MNKKKVVCSGIISLFMCIPILVAIVFETFFALLFLPISIPLGFVLIGILDDLIVHSYKENKDDS